MSETTIKEVTLSERVQKLVGEEKSHTMYRAANVMSEIVGVRVREQMLYNYRAKKLIRVNSVGRVTTEDLVVFIQKRLDKNQK